MDDSTHAGAGRFAIRVDPAFRELFAALGAGARHDFVELEGTTIRVRLGWLFKVSIPKAAVTTAQHHADMYGGWGAHGWRGRWLVNDSSAGIVELDLEPRQRAWLLGIWPLTLRVLYVSLEDTDGFLAAIDSAVP
jgi:hypothetical protein